MLKMKRQEAIKAIKSCTDRNYKVTFVKQDGSKRKMFARQGVNGAPEEPNGVMLTTFDVDKWDYRKINLATISRLELEGVKYKVID